MNNNKKNLIKRAILIPVAFGGILLVTTAYWILHTWADLRLEEILYQMNAPLTGTGSGLIGSFVLQCILPAAIVTVLVFLLAWVLPTKRELKS